MTNSLIYHIKCDKTSYRYISRNQLLIIYNMTNSPSINIYNMSKKTDLSYIMCKNRRFYHILYDTLFNLSYKM